MAKRFLVEPYKESDIIVTLLFRPQQGTTIEDPGMHRRKKPNVGGRVTDLN